MYFRDYVLTSHMVDCRTIGDLQTQSHQQIAPVLPENQRLVVKHNENVISDGRSNEDTLSTTSDVESVLSEAGSTTSSSAGLAPMYFLDDLFSTRGLN